ncbi:MAG: hypothetical protein KA004_10120 [Verrucomicrobiales bacterium]|nr:hypothetical protein [Verrucomicrobiales bacterium]
MNFRLVCFLVLTPLGAAVTGEISPLWGHRGEKWNPAGRLPDVSFAGYACGERPIPEPEVTANVRSFGAKGDGAADDSAAFAEAIMKTARGVVFIPPGKYKLTRILEISKPDIVLRGAGPDKTILVCPVPLNEIRPNWGATTGGRRTSNYSWSGGMVWFKGRGLGKKLGKVAAPARRGDVRVVLSESAAAGLSPGGWIELRQMDDARKSLVSHLYSDDPGDVTKIAASRHRESLIARVKSVSGPAITLDRPLRTDVRLEWNPEIATWEPSVRECGIESIRFEFPARSYGGHFTELGFNAIAFQDVAHCWARRIELVNADSGIFASGRFCTLSGIVSRLDGSTANKGDFGHHGITLGGSDNLLADFDLRQRFIHDITVSGGSGNVARAGRGWDLSFDHHKRAPHDNVFTNIDAGEGTRLWRSGGGDALGRHCGARGTFWNIRSQRGGPAPAGFGPADMNFLGFVGDHAPGVSPPDLYRAQLERRLGK